MEASNKMVKDLKTETGFNERLLIEIQKLQQQQKDIEEQQNHNDTLFKNMQERERVLEEEKEKLAGQKKALRDEAEKFKAGIAGVKETESTPKKAEKQIKDLKEKLEATIKEVGSLKVELDIEKEGHRKTAEHNRAVETANPNSVKICLLYTSPSPRD